MAPTMKTLIVQVKARIDWVAHKGQDSRPSKKEYHPGGAICSYNGMALAFPATPSPGASVEGA